MTDQIIVNVAKFGKVLEQLTPRDIIDFQRQTGVSIAQALAEVGRGGDNFQLSETQALAMAGLVWLVVRKDNPDFTFDQAMDVPFTSLQTGEEGDEEEVGFTPTPEQEPQ